jgi:hypothetical protein
VNDFDPEVEFDEAIKLLGEADGGFGDRATAMREQAKVTLLAVVAHQLGAIARHFEGEPE